MSVLAVKRKLGGLTTENVSCVEQRKRVGLASVIRTTVAHTAKGVGRSLAFFTTSVEKKMLMQKIRDNPSLGIALSRLQPDEREIDEFAEKQLTQKDDDFLTIQIIGVQGCGKSGVGQVFAVKYAKNEFTVENISLQYDEFMTIVETLENGHFSILDEQTRLHGTGSRRLGDDIVNIIETLRQNGGSIIIISPTEKMVSTSDVHLEIHVLGRDEDRVLCAWRARSKAFLGSFIIKLNWNDKLWMDYMEKKRDYVQAAKKQQFFKTDFEKIAHEVLQHEDAPFATKIKELALILEKTHPNLTVEEKKLVLAQITLMRKKEA